MSPRAGDPPLRDARHGLVVMVLKTEKCSFSGLRVYPGHGMRLTKQDSSTFLFLNGKCKKLAAQKKKPAKLAWTTTYRKAHKKVRRRARVGEGNAHERWRTLAVDGRRRRAFGSEKDAHEDHPTLGLVGRADPTRRVRPRERR